MRRYEIIKAQKEIAYKNRKSIKKGYEKRIYYGYYIIYNKLYFVFLFGCIECFLL